MEIAVLGPVEVRRDGESVDLGTPRQRAIVAALALSGGRTVHVDTVIARVWADRPPSGALATLHGYVAALRRALEPDRAPRAEPRVLVTDNDGYALRGCAVAVDVVELESAVAAARSALSVVPDHLRPRADPADRPEVTAVVGVLDQALARWRGLEPYAARGRPVGHDRTVRLTGLRIAAQSCGRRSAGGDGRPGGGAGWLGMLTAEHPLRGVGRALYAVALGSQRPSGRRPGRPPVAALGPGRVPSSGSSPSPPVRDLQATLLRQDSTVGSDERAHPAPGGQARAARMAQRSAEPRESATVSARRWPGAEEGDAPVARRAGHRDLRPSPAMVLMSGEAGVGKPSAQELAVDASSRAPVATGRARPRERRCCRIISRDRLLALPPAGDVRGADRATSRPSPSDDVGTVDSLARPACGPRRTAPCSGVFEDLRWRTRPRSGCSCGSSGSAQREPLLVVATLARGGAVVAR